MTNQAEHAEPRRYRVRLTQLDGTHRDVPVITDRGPLKAVFLASATFKTTVRRKALDISVTDIGPVEVDERGIGILDGHIFDRQEW